MTEVYQVNNMVKKYLAPYGRVERIENRLTSGWPDYYLLLRRVPSWLECKLIEPSGKIPDHFTLDQIMWGEAEVRNGGRWHLLARCGPAWWLMDSAGCRSWYQGGPPVPLFSITGRFPVREILDVIAPLEANR